MTKGYFALINGELLLRNKGADKKKVEGQV